MAHPKEKIAMLRQNFEKAVDDYLTAFLKQMDWDRFYGYWIADDCSGIYAYGDQHFISLADIIYSVDNNVTNEELVECEEYNVWATNNWQSTISLASWHKGYRGVPKEGREKIDKLRMELNELIKETKEKY